MIPGFQTSILKYEHDLLLDIDLTHKLVRNVSVLEWMYGIYHKCNENFSIFRERMVKELVGKIVMTK